MLAHSGMQGLRPAAAVAGAQTWCTVHFIHVRAWAQEDRPGCTGACVRGFEPVPDQARRRRRRAGRTGCTGSSRTRDQGKTAAAASLGMITLWDVEGGLPQIDKYLYSKDNHVVAGAPCPWR